MKLKNCLITAVALSALGLAAVAQAQNVFFQAGDIKVGQQWPISANSGIASYYKDGTSGVVKFNCVLGGSNDAQAFLFPGKNFIGNGNQATYLKTGMNGPYAWTLSNQGNNDGNIKIEYLKGSNVTIQCKQTN